MRGTLKRRNAREPTPLVAVILAIWKRLGLPCPAFFVPRLSTSLPINTVLPTCLYHEIDHYEFYPPFHRFFFLSLLGISAHAIADSRQPPTRGAPRQNPPSSTAQSTEPRVCRVISAEEADDIPRSPFWAAVVDELEMINRGNIPLLRAGIGTPWF